MRLTSEETAYLKDLITRDAELSTEILNDKTGHYSAVEVEDAKRRMSLAGRLLLELEL